MLILYAEDESDLAQLTIDYLDCENIECDYAYDGVMAMNLLAKQHYDVIVLDINMPRLDGFSVCQKLKSSGDNTPVIFLTARDDLSDKLAGFALGADDYLTKPFEVDELVARIKVLAQRKTIKNNVFQIDSLIIDFTARSVSRADRVLALTPNQWSLLTLLAQQSPAVVARLSLENSIWPEQIPSKDMLKTLVFRLRTLIDGEHDKALIHTIRGVGIALKEGMGE
jgi:two-component system, OmpR family, response regulator